MINEIVITRKFNLGNYELIDIRIGYTFPAKLGNDEAISEVSARISNDLKKLKAEALK